MERISVAIRVRPPTKEEYVKGNRWVIEENENKVTLCNCYGAPMSGYSYAFDRMFGPSSKNCEVYNVHAKEVVLSAMQGFNGTVFAYGQTSSGKTFTMQGSDDQPGIIRLSIHDVFNSISKTSGREFLARVSYMEIYNEEINDLLAPENRKLQIHENFERGLFVAGLREEIVNSPEQVLDFLSLGEAHRHKGQTNMNLYSSRSHTIFRMVIESRDKSRNTDAVRVSTLNMVDLAGSERVAKTGAGGVRLKEGTHINKSLMTLGNVIHKLSEGGKGGHIPYRDSKLTRILQSALDGNAKTAIICTITPDEIHIDETRGTLQFASRAKKVATCAHVNEILTDAALLKRQKREIEELRQKLLGLRSDDFEQQLLKLRNDLLKYELEKEKLALELEEERKGQSERERRIREQEQKIENLSSLVISSTRDDRQTRSNNRRETWSPQQVMADPTTKDYFRSPLSRLDNSLISMRRERGKSMTPLPAFEALIEKDRLDLRTPTRKLDDFLEISEFSLPSNDIDENSWTELNKQNVAEEDTWTQLNKRLDNEWINLNNEKEVDPVKQEFSPCVKSEKSVLLEFEFNELQVQFEELQCQYNSKNEEASESREKLRLLSESYDEARNHLDNLRRENALLQETNLELDASRSSQDQEMKRQLNELLSKIEQLNVRISDLEMENNLVNKRLESTNETKLVLEGEVVLTKKQLSSVMEDREQIDNRLRTLVAENDFLRDDNQRLKENSEFQEQELARQMDNLIVEKNEASEQLFSLVRENERLQETNRNLEKAAELQQEAATDAQQEFQNLLTTQTNLEQSNQRLQLSLESARSQEREARKELQDMVAMYNLLDDSYRSKTNEMHELSARLLSLQEEKTVNQEALIERLQMSREQIFTVEEEAARARAERDGLSNTVFAQVQRNKELIATMKLERMRFAQELSRYLSTLTCQQDSISAVCSGISSIVKA